MEFDNFRNDKTLAPTRPRLQPGGHAGQPAEVQS